MNIELKARVIILAIALAAGSCGSSEEAIPPDIVSSYLAKDDARFALTACREPSELRLIAQADREAERVRSELLERFGRAAVDDLHRTSIRRFEVKAVMQCGGIPAIRRYQLATARLSDRMRDRG